MGVRVTANYMSPAAIAQRCYHSKVFLGRSLCRITLAGGIFAITCARLHAQNWQFSYDLHGDVIARASANAAAPQIIGQPQQQVLEPGKTASFSVTVANAQGVSYQWRFNNNPIGGATSDTLVVNNVTAANEGQYS